jgi:HJR/Mrr/RecB family endonuclease
MALTHEELSDLWRSAAYGSNGAWTPSPQSNEPSGQFEDMDWQGFEEWVLQRLKERGYQANRTPRSGDGGADGVFLKFGPNGGAGLIQCKHTGNPDLVQDDTAIRNLIEARSRYALKHPRLIAITNAKRFSMLAQSKAAMEGVDLFTRADLLTFHEAFD